MARYVDIHPQNPQPRGVQQAVDLLTGGGLLACPTDSGYALVARLGNAEALDRIRTIRALDDKHHFTLLCRDFSQLGQMVHVDNAIFRLVKSATPGPYTFILPATPEVPKRMLHPRKRTVGARIPDHAVVSALLAELGEPLLSSTLILPGSEEALTEAWLVDEAIGSQVDAVVESGEVTAEPTTVVDLTDGVPEVVREGAGDVSRFV